MTKRVRDTSIAVYHDDIKPSLGRREQIVLDALKTWQGPAPTSYELTEALMARGLAFDLNAVRPRLSSLQDKQLVTTAGKRECHITGKRSYTWQLSSPSPVANTLLDLLEAQS